MTYLVIRTADGRVINAVEGEPPATDGFDSAPREGAAQDVWIGWTRNGDGTFADTSADWDPLA